MVDVIHTDITIKGSRHTGTGITQTSGHVDFYPNAGYPQPGCVNDVTGLEELNYTQSTGEKRFLVFLLRVMAALG